MSRFVVLGSGISGATAAFELARGGNQVQIVEAGGRFGGKVLDYCCKATDACSRCGVCVAMTQLQTTLRLQGVTVSMATEVREIGRGEPLRLRCRRTNPALDYHRCVACDACLSACPEGCIHRYERAGMVLYHVDHARCLLHRGQNCSACAQACPTEAVLADGPASNVVFTADALLLATGHRPYPAERKVRLGYGRLPGVMTATEAEAALSEREALGNGGERVAFIQCVGSRDAREGRNYCSSVCCAYALRLARMLRYRDPAAELTVYYIDLQSFDKTFPLLRAEMQAAGIRFVRGIPFQIQDTPDGKLRLMAESAEGTFREAEHDRVILSVGMEPEEGAAKLAQMVGIPCNEHGFFQSARPSSGATARPGVYVCGTCQEPQGIAESMAAARAVALEMMRRHPWTASPAGTAASAGG